MLHNELKDVNASLLTEACHEIKIEPDQQPSNGEVFIGPSTITQNGARLGCLYNVNSGE